MVAVLAVVGVLATAGVVVWQLVEDDGPSSPFPTAALQTAAAPFRPHLGTCDIDAVGDADNPFGRTTTVCRAGENAPGQFVFVEYRQPTDMPGAYISDQTSVVHGARNGGFLAVSDELTWRDNAKNVWIRMDTATSGTSTG